MLIVYLSCHFDMGKLLFHGQEVPRVAVLDVTHILTMSRTYRDPKLSSMWWGYSFARGMRFSTYDLKHISHTCHHINLNHFKMPMIGAMRAQSYQVPYFESLEVYKLTNLCFPLRRGLSFNFC